MIIINRAMYMVVRKDYRISKIGLARVGFNLAFNYLYEEYIKPHPYVNEHYDIINNFHKNKKVEFEYISQVEMEELDPNEYVIIRDNGLTQLKPNTLTCASKGIYNGVMIIYINKDINLGRGKMCSQISHNICSLLYHKYIKHIPYVDLYSFTEYMKVQKKIVLKCSLEEMKRHRHEAKATITVSGEVLAYNMGIFNKDYNEVPDWIKNLKLYGR